MTGNGARTGRNNGPKPPKDLSPSAKRVWQQPFDASEVDPVAEPLLHSFCQHWDTVQQARALLAKEGIILTEKTAAGLEKRRAHPAVSVERDASAAMMRAWRLLGYDQAPPEGM
jgi:phage terminase small subunit